MGLFSWISQKVDQGTLSTIENMLERMFMQMEGSQEYERRLNDELFSFAEMVYPAKAGRTLEWMVDLQYLVEHQTHPSVLDDQSNQMMALANRMRKEGLAE